MIFNFLLAIDKIDIEPWYISPDVHDNLKRMVCWGWTCHSSEYLEHQKIEFREILGNYTENTYNQSLKDDIFNLIHRGYKPALCAAGFYHLIGYADFEKNLTKSYELLKNGSKTNLWACHDILAFHPLETNQDEEMKLSIQSGGIWSMIKYILKNYPDNINTSLIYEKHLATAATYNWWKRRRSGNEFAKNVAVILNVSEGFSLTPVNYSSEDLQNAWKFMENESKKGHIPAALWTAEGLITGEIGRKNLTEAYEVLLPFVLNGQWSIDTAEVLDKRDEIDIDIVMNIAAQLNNSLANAYLSYKYLF